MNLIALLILAAATETPLFADAFECFDTDGDRLSDCDEIERGTRLDLADTDADGLPDGDEVLGTRDGLYLPAFGVSPLRRELLLEHDWFEADAHCGPHTHQPEPEALARVTELFARGGIHVVHVVSGPVVGFDEDLPGWFDATFVAIKAAHMDANRVGYFHYALHAHSFGAGVSGGAKLDGPDLLVTLACTRHAGMQSSVLAHELGHNLGLLHGGDTGCNRKPNYPSVMNLLYEFSVLDFSRGAEPPIDERIDGIDRNPGSDATCGGALTVLTDHDDWLTINQHMTTSLRRPAMP